MVDLLEIASNLGAGAFLAVIIFILSLRFIKNTVKAMRDDRKYSEDRLTKLIEEDQDTRKEHTEAITELTTLVKRLNGH